MAITATTVITFDSSWMRPVRPATPRWGLGRGMGRALLTLGDDVFHVIGGDENAARLTGQTPLFVLFAPCCP